MIRLPLLLAFVLAMVGRAAAQAPLRVLPDDKETPKMLYRFLQKEAQKHFDTRRQVIANLKTPDDIKKRQQDLKAKFIEAIGGLPEKTPLEPQVTGTMQGDGFTVEKVVFQSRPNHHVTANFYLPTKSGQGDGKRFPGVLVPCGHSVNGKAAEAYQRACILMARNGLAVLCYDPIGQGERVQLLDKTGKPLIAGSTSEHTAVGVGALLVGQTTAGYRIWDGIRALDYLASRPEVDSKRLGCTGNSGGGTLTAYLMALDERIVCAAPSCYITTLEKLFDTLGPQDAEQNIPGQVAFGMEHADYVTMRAPLPTLLCVGTYDFFDIGGAWTTFREAKIVYGRLGYGERVSLFEFEDKHGFSRPRREAAMRWMRQWLLNKNDAPFEDDFRSFKDADLQCTRSGQVLEDFKGVSAFDLNVKRAQELAAQRKKLPPANLAQEVRKLLRLPDSWPHPKGIEAAVAALGTGKSELSGFRGGKTALPVEPGLVVPVAYFAPEKASGRPVIVLHENGWAAEANAGGRIERLLKEGRAVIGVDLRGMGELSPVKKATMFGDSKEAFLAMHIDRPLLGQRVLDLLTVVGGFAKKSGGEVEVIATGSTGPIALHAAALDKRIAALTLVRSLDSWEHVVRTPLAQNQLTNVVPGALKVYDLPDLVALVAPRPLNVVEPVDAAGKVLAK